VLREKGRERERGFKKMKRKRKYNKIILTVVTVNFQIRKLIVAIVNKNAILQVLFEEGKLT
jgi:hypothetical protein